MGPATAKKILAPPPGALGRGQKVKYHLYLITKSISNSKRLPLGHFHEPIKILYHAKFFFSENVILLHLLHMFNTNFITEANTMNPIQT